jgi:hypothetical protein
VPDLNENQLRQLAVRLQKARWPAMSARTGTRDARSQAIAHNAQMRSKYSDEPTKCAPL